MFSRTNIFLKQRCYYDIVHCISGLQKRFKIDDFTSTSKILNQFGTGSPLTFVEKRPLYCIIDHESSRCASAFF